MRYVGDGESPSLPTILSWSPNPSNSSASVMPPLLPVTLDFIVKVTNTAANQKHPVEIDIGCFINTPAPTAKDTCSISGFNNTLRVDVFTP